MRSNWIRVSPNPVTATLIGRGKFEYRHRKDTLGEHHVKMEAEIEVICLQAKEYQGLMATTRS